MVIWPHSTKRETVSKCQPTVSLVTHSKIKFSYSKIIFLFFLSAGKFSQIALSETYCSQLGESML